MNMKNIQLTADDLLPLLVKWTGRLRELREDHEVTILKGNDFETSESFAQRMGQIDGSINELEFCHDDLAKFMQSKIKEFNSAKTSEWMEVVHGPRTTMHVE